MIKIYDDVVEDHVAQLISAKMKDVRWKFDYHSNREHKSRHWHVLCGNSGQQIITNGFEWVIPIGTSTTIPVIK